MNNNFLRKGLVIGVILLFLCLAYIPIINARTDLFTSKSTKSLIYNSSSNYWPKYVFFIISFKGEIKNLKILGEHSYHFDIVGVVEQNLYVFFLYGIIPIPTYAKQSLYNISGWDLDWSPGNIYSREKITDNYIDFFSIYLGPY